MLTPRRCFVQQEVTACHVMGSWLITSSGLDERATSASTRLQRLPVPSWSVVDISGAAAAGLQAATC